MKRCKHGKPCFKHMLEASKELTELLKRYGDALDEVSHRDLAKTAGALTRRAKGLRSIHPGGSADQDDGLGIHME